VREIKTLEDNEKFCKKISQTLQEHLTVNSQAVNGSDRMLDLMKPEDMDKFMNTILRSVCLPTLQLPRMNARSTNKSPAYLPPSHSRAASRPDRNLQFSLHFPDSPNASNAGTEFVGEVFLKCNAGEVVTRCYNTILSLSSATYGAHNSSATLKLSGT